MVANGSQRGSVKTQSHHSTRVIHPQGKRNRLTKLLHLINPKGADNARSAGLVWKARFGDRRDAASAKKENLMSGQEERGGHPTLEKIDVRVELVRHGLPVETVTVGFEGLVHHPELARRIAAVLELEAAELWEDLP